MQLPLLSFSFFFVFNSVLGSPRLWVFTGISSNKEGLVAFGCWMLEPEVRIWRIGHLFVGLVVMGSGGVGHRDGYITAPV